MFRFVSFYLFPYRVHDAWYNCFTTTTKTGCNAFANSQRDPLSGTHACKVIYNFRKSEFLIIIISRLIKEISSSGHLAFL